MKAPSKTGNRLNSWNLRRGTTDSFGRLEKGTRASVTDSARMLNRLRQLKSTLTGQLRSEFGHSIDTRLFHQAIQEADSLASTTAFPSLFLPALAEEKVRKVYRWSQRQRVIREQSMALAV